MLGNIIQLDADVNEAQIQSAIYALRDGDTLILPKGKTISVANGLNVDVANRSVTIDLNGATLKQAGDTSVISIAGDHVAGATATLGTTPGGAVTIAYVGAGNVAVGDYVKIYSDDLLPNDQGALTRLGQAMLVTAVDGGTLTVGGELHYADLYKSNVRASAYENGTVVLKNGTVIGDQSHPDWIKPLVEARSTIGTQFDRITVRDGNSMGINFADTVNGLVTQSAAINLTDDTANGHYGYGVHSGMSIGTTVNGFYADKVRHATDDNSVGLTATHVNAAKYGADFGMNVSNVIANANTAFAFSWHSEGRFNSISDSLVFNSFGVLGGRGVDNSFSHVAGAGNYKGILFFEYGEGDGRRINVSDVHLKENSGYAYYKQNNPQENTLADSSFEILSNKVTLADDDPFIKITNTALKIGAFATDELMTGSEGADQVLGAKGNDLISAKGGDDYVWGGEGVDTLVGGEGTDRFAYHNMLEAGDVINDFAVGTGGDVIDVAVMSYQLGWRSLEGHVRFVQSGLNTLFQVDSDGSSDSYLTVATLANVIAADLVAANVSTDIVVAKNGHSSAGKVVSVAAGPGELPVQFSDLNNYLHQIGRANNDTLLGTDGTDLLIGRGGADYLDAGAGDDVLAGGSGPDTLRGGSGKDTASYADAFNGVVASLVAPTTNIRDAAGDYYSQIENLTGSAFGDKLTGNGSMNEIFGGEGNDLLYGLDGVDLLIGGKGSDLLDGGLKGDTLMGGEGDDYLLGGAGYDVYNGGGGVDRFILGVPGSGVDRIEDFQHGVDRIGLAGYGLSTLADMRFFSGLSPKATINAPTLLYNSGTGSLWYDQDGKGIASAINIANLVGKPELTQSDFFLVSGDSDSYVTVATTAGLSAPTLVEPTKSLDTIVSADDHLDDDVLVSGPAAPNDLLEAFADLATYLRQNGQNGNDTLTGTGEGDLLIGLGGADYLDAGAGDDVLAGGAGADTLRGGSGKDTASYADASTGVIAGLLASTANSGDAAGDTYSQIENLKGSAFADTLYGSDSMNELNGGAGDDHLYGLGGVDRLNGGSGSDYLEGGLQNDILFGGAGDDYFAGGAGYDRYNGGEGTDHFIIDVGAGADRIEDFEHSIDRIGLSAIGITSLSDVVFISGSSARPVSTSPTLAYNNETGAIWWDIDGSGSAAAINIANLGNRTQLDVNDFFLA